MSNENYRRRRWLRHFMTVAVLSCVAAAMPLDAFAATARVTWLPRGAGTVTEYRVYVRNGGTAYGAAAPAWKGNPTPAADGSVSALVTYTPASAGVNFFSVVAVGSEAGESGLSVELPIGGANPCRADVCTTKTACNFALRPDGFACDDAVFCNGAEVCRAGVCDASVPRNCGDAIDCTEDVCDEESATCIHAGPPGCCPACDSDDPCVADACAAGQCAVAEGSDLAVNRVRFMNKRSGVKLAGKGSFLADPALDPRQTGVAIEMRSLDGSVVYRASIAGHLLKAGASGERFRFSSGNSTSSPDVNGITRLDFRIKGGMWRTTIKAETPALAEAFTESSLTLVMKLGGSCVRRMHMPCSPTSALSICR